MKEITELKKAMQAYITAKKACDKAEEEMVRTESEETEKAFDLTYKEQFNAYLISEKEARSLINTNESEVVSLIEKLGA